MILHYKKDEFETRDYGEIHCIHHFPFDKKTTRKHPGIGPLRVLNDETIDVAAGYENHKHRDMEIITYVYQGKLSYQDSLGHTGHLQKGSVQYLSAGSGITHKEENEGDEPLKLVQLWIEPNERGINPYYTNISILEDVRKNQLVHIISNKEKNGKITIKQHINIYITELKHPHIQDIIHKDNTQLYGVLLEGNATVNTKSLSTHDAFLTDESVTLKTQNKAHFLLVEIIH